MIYVIPYIFRRPIRALKVDFSPPFSLQRENYSEKKSGAVFFGSKNSPGGRNFKVTQSRFGISEKAFSTKRFIKILKTAKIRELRKSNIRSYRPNFKLNVVQGVIKISSSK